MHGVYTNIQGLINNFNQLEIIVYTKTPDFIVLTETHLTTEIEEQEIRLQDYDNYITYSNSTRTGGIIIYLKKAWKVTKIYEKMVESKFWISAYTAKLNKTQFIIMGVYRSPSSRETEFCEAFEQAIEEVNENDSDLIVAGDFNIDWAKNGTYKYKLEAMLNDNGLKQVVNEYTRITKHSKTIIDYIISNNENIKVKTNSSNKISDHEAIDIKIEETSANVEQHEEIEIFKYNKDLFNKELSKMPIYNERIDLNNNVSNFDFCLEKTIKKCTRKKLIKTNNCVKMWFSAELKQLKKEKIINYNIAKTENTTAAWNRYKLIRNTYKNKTESEKEKYVNSKINNAKDQKQMWKQIKELVLKRNKNVIKTVIFNEIEYKDNFQIATQFNKYFVDSIKSIRDTIENVQYINNIPVITNRFRFRTITIQELKDICKKLEINQILTKFP